MNKAFVREPDEPELLRCPRCDVPGRPVGRTQLQAHLPADAATALGNSSFYCGNPACGVGYFDSHEQFIPADQLTHRAYPKWPDAPLCPCLGLTAADVEADAQQQDPGRVREALQRAKSADAPCAQLHPACRPCTGEIQKLYLRHLPGSR